MNIVGFGITVVGFPLTIWSANEARRAALEAKRAVETYQMRRVPIEVLGLARAAKACLDSRISATHPEIQKEYNRLLRGHLVRFVSYCQKNDLTNLELSLLEARIEFLTEKPKAVRLPANWSTSLANSLIALEQDLLQVIERTCNDTSRPIQTREGTLGENQEQ